MVALCIATAPITTLSQTAEEIIRNHCDSHHSDSGDCIQNMTRMHAQASAHGPEGYEKRYAEIYCSDSSRGSGDCINDTTQVDGLLRKIPATTTAEQFKP